MFEELSELTGFAIIATYGFTFAFYVFKFIFMKFGARLKQVPKLQKTLAWMLKFLRRFHRLTGILTIGLILMHLVLMVVDEGWNLTGLFAAGFMLAEVGMGAALAYLKPKTKTVRIIHRLTAFAVGIAIVVHIV